MREIILEKKSFTKALTKLEEAMHWLHHRTKDRVKRGVEGTNKL